MIVALVAGIILLSALAALAVSTWDMAQGRHPCPLCRSGSHRVPDLQGVRRCHTCGTLFTDHQEEA